MLLVATSGDTGGAVAHSFEGMDDVKVVILYPAGKVSTVQELQLTTIGKNIRAIKVDGDFDACQQLVKSALADSELREQYQFISANSINVGRWLSQQFYYWFALQQWKDKTPPVISVPSGNLGNLCAGLAAHVSGMPATGFVASCNKNDAITRYFQSGQLNPQVTVPTLSNAMDVGNPNNFIRMQRFIGHPEITTDAICSYSISDKETVDTIHQVWNKYTYLLDPHGAVAYAGLQRYLEKHPGRKGILLGTAHPIKFREVLEQIIHQPLEENEAIGQLFKKRQFITPIACNYSKFKAILMNES